MCYHLIPIMQIETIDRVMLQHFYYARKLFRLLTPQATLFLPKINLKIVLEFTI